MKTSGVRRVVLAAIATTGIVAAVFVPSVEANQETAAVKAQPSKGAVIRGCLIDSKLTHVDPQNLAADLELKLPDTLKVSSIRVIRDQVKALNGHQVEITGALRGIPGMETGILVADSDHGKLYIGGGDPRLGSDMSVSRNEPPTIHAQMIKNIADACQSQPK